MGQTDIAIKAKYTPQTITVEFYIDDEIRYSETVLYSENLENLYDLPVRIGFNGHWHLNYSENQVYRYSAKYVPDTKYFDRVYWARYKICGQIRYLVPFTIRTGILYDFPIDPRLGCIIGWKYIPLEAHDCDIELTSDPDEIKKAKVKSAIGKWVFKNTNERDAMGSHLQIWYNKNELSKTPADAWKVGRGFGSPPGDRIIKIDGIELPLKQLGTESKFFEILSENQIFNCETDSYINQILDEHSRYQDLCKSTKYHLVFLGEPGKGKTTAICNWLNLLKKDKNGLNSIDSAPLLKTATGRTTAFEVHLSLTEGPSYIRIEPWDRSHQLELIEAFSKVYFESCGRPTGFITNINLPEEINRMIRNMARLKNPAIGSEKEDAISFISQFDDSNEFYEYLVDTVNVDNRRKTIFKYNSSYDEFDNWLSQLFKDINDGMKESVSIPKTMYICINPNEFELNLPERFTEVIDTIGLDDPSATERIQQLLTSPDTLCVFIEDLEQVPSVRLCTLFSEVFSNENRIYAEKTAILVKSPYSKLGAVPEAEGSVEKGKEYKLSQIEQKIRSKKIPYNIEHTMFLDPCIAYTSNISDTLVFDKNGEPLLDEHYNPIIEQKIEWSYSESKAKLFRKEMTETLEKIATHYRNKLLGGYASILKKIDKKIVSFQKESICDRAPEYLSQYISDSPTKYIPIFELDGSLNLYQTCLKNKIEPTRTELNFWVIDYTQQHTAFMEFLMKYGYYCKYCNPGGKGVNRKPAWRIYK